MLAERTFSGPGGVVLIGTLAIRPYLFSFFFYVRLIGVLIRPVGVYFYLVHFLVAITNLLGGGYIATHKSAVQRHLFGVSAFTCQTVPFFFLSSAIDLIQPLSYPHIQMTPFCKHPPHL